MPVQSISEPKPFVGCVEMSFQHRYDIELPRDVERIVAKLHKSRVEMKHEEVAHRKEQNDTTVTVSIKPSDITSYAGMNLKPRRRMMTK